MAIRKTTIGKIGRKSQVESLELRALLSGDGVVPVEPPEPVDPAVVSGPIEPGLEDPGLDPDFAPPNPMIFEEGDFGGTVEDATYLPQVFGFAEARGSIAGPTDQDVFQLDGIEAGGVEVYPETPGLALKVTVLDADGNEIASGDSSIPSDGAPGVIGPAAAEFEIADAGNFFILVESLDGSEGDYGLQVVSFRIGVEDPILIEVPTEDEFGVDAHGGELDETATLLEFNGDIAFASSFIDRDADSDVFQFVAPTAETGIDAFGELPLVVNIHDAEGNLISNGEERFEEDPDDLFHPFFAAVETVPGETYFVSVGSTKGQVGRFDLHLFAVQPFVPPTPDSPLGEDIHGDTLETATALAFGEHFIEVVSNIDSDTDVDVFAISLPGGSALFGDVFSLEGTPLSVRLLNADGEPVSDHPLPDDEPFFGPLEVFHEDTEAGTYFVEVSGATGLYHLNLFAETFVDPGGPGHSGPLEIDAPLGEDMHGDTLETATPLLFEADLLSSVFTNIDSDSDRDVFAVKPNSNGDEILFDVVTLGEEGLALDIQVLGPDGELAAFQVDSMMFGPEPEPEPEPGLPNLYEGFFDPEAEGLHYISIGSTGGTGAYQLNVFNPPPSDLIPPVGGGGADSKLGEDPHGDTADDATQVLFEFDSFVHSFIDTAGDVDTFVFKPHGEFLFFDIGSLGGQAMSVEVRDADLNVVPIDELSVIEEEAFVSGQVSVEVGSKYFVSVSSTAEGTGEYTLMLTNFPDDPIVILPPDIILPPDLPPVDPGEPFLEPDAELGDDLHGETLDDATALSLNENGFIEVSSNIDQTGDVDAFRLVGNGDLIVAELGGFGATEMVFQVFAENGDKITESFAGGSFEFETNADDTYFVTAHSEGDDPGQYFMFLQPVELVDLGPVDPIPVEPVDPNPPGRPVGPPDVEFPVVEPVDPAVPTTDGPDDGGTTNQEARQLTADLDGDGVVSFADFLALSANFGKEVDAAFADGDINGDGIVDLADFLVLSDEYGVA